MTADLQERIGLALAPLPGVRAAWVFGSRAPGGSPRADSDLDLAVVFDRTLTAEARHALSKQIYVALVDVLGAVGERVDLLDLERAGSAVGFRAIRDGACVLDRRDGEREQMVARVARRYDDDAPHRELFRRAAIAAARRL